MVEVEPTSAAVSTNGRRPGFVGHTTARNATKGAVLMVLAAADEALTLKEICVLSGLGYGQVRGSLARLVQGEYVGQSSSRDSPRYVHILTPLGARWLREAARCGEIPKEWADAPMLVKDWPPTLSGMEPTPTERRVETATAKIAKQVAERRKRR